MFKFLFVLFFFFILLLVLMGFSVLRMFKNFLFGSESSGRKSKKGHQTSHTSSRSSSSSREEPTVHVHRKKIFTEDDGEYVDYEEVK